MTNSNVNELVMAEFETRFHKCKMIDEGLIISVLGISRCNYKTNNKNVWVEVMAGTKMFAFNDEINTDCRNV